MSMVSREFFIDGLWEWIRHSKLSYWGSKRHDTVNDLAHGATSLTKLQHGSGNTDAPVTTTRWITDVEIPGTEVVALTKLFRTYSRRLNRLASMGRPLGLDGLQFQCRCSTNSHKVRHIRLNPHHLWGQWKTGLSADSVWQATIQRHNARPFRLSSVRRSSTWAEPIFPLLQNTSDSTQKIRTADVHWRNKDEDRRYKVQ